MNLPTMEAQELRRCLRDLVALSTLPAVWQGYSAERLADSLADILCQTLSVDLAYVVTRVGAPSADGRDRVAVRIGDALEGMSREEIASVVSAWLAQDATLRPHSVSLSPLAAPVRLLAASFGYDGALGGLVVGSVSPGFPTATDQLLLSVTANQAAVALQRLAAEQRVQERTAELTRANDALRQSEARIRRIFDANLVGLLYAHLDGRFVSANDKFLELVGYSREELEGGAMDKERLTAPEYRDVYREAIRQVRENGLAPLYEKEYIRKNGTRVPVLIGSTLLEPGGDVMAAFVLDLTPLKQTQAELFAANARLTAALTRERNIAVALQRSLTQMPAQDAFAGLQVDAVYEPAWEEADVGGDFMDAFLLDPERIAVVVGDVSGKGLGAAARTAEIKYTLRGMLYERRSPAAALNGLNDYLCEAQRRSSESSEEFVCVGVAVVECATGKVALSVAGLEPPLVIRLQGAAEEAQVRGTPLGVFAGMEYGEEETELGHGDLLLLTTDGITEARRGSEFFGYESLTRAAAQRRHTVELAELAKGLVNEAREFAGGAMHDDACLLLVRRV